MALILVVDDLSYLRALVRHVLEAAGHEVAEAADGLQAIAAYRDRPADLVLCDMWMPGMRGLKVLRELRREFPTVRVIAMSAVGEGGRDAFPQALKLGAVDVLAKPFRPENLVAAVERQCGQDRGWK